MDPPRPKCASCPQALPACGGQIIPALCNPDNAGTIDPDTGLPVAPATPETTAGVDASRGSIGVTASSIFYDWPAI